MASRFGGVIEPVGEIEKFRGGGGGSRDGWRSWDVDFLHCWVNNEDIITKILFCCWIFFFLIDLDQFGENSWSCAMFFFLNEFFIGDKKINGGRLPRRLLYVRYSRLGVALICEKKWMATQENFRISNFSSCAQHLKLRLQSLSQTGPWQWLE